MVPTASAQAGRESPSVSAGLGTIEGRVINGRSGDYLETVRITIEGGSLQTFTDNFGQYRIAQVPAGEVKVTAFYTGLPPQTIAVTVAAGQSARLDFDLAARDKDRATDLNTVRLSEFVVSTSKEMDGAAIAINEQRFAANMRNVVAANEFGPIADASVGDILKFLPGVAIEYDSGSVPRGVSLNGVPMDNVPVTVNGFDLATAQIGRTTQRMTDLRYVSTNNLSRMEVVYSPTPESPGMALAGSVNLVTRSAFERSKPVFNYSVVMHVPDDERHFDATPKPEKRSRKITPGLDFSYVVPVNKRFGLTLSANLSKIYHRQEIAANTWSGAGSATNGVALPHTTPDMPYLSSYSLLDGPWEDVRYSAAMTLDYKLSANNRVSLSFQGVHLDIVRANRQLAFNVGRVLPGFTRTSVPGAVGAGVMNISNNTPHITKTSYMPTLVFRHDGPIWKAEAGLGYAYAINQEDITPDAFNSSTVRRTNLTISFDDIIYLRPGRITVTDGTTGAPVDPFDINSYVIASGSTAANGDGPAQESSSLKRSAYANTGREFFWRVPVSLKTGLDVRESRVDTRSWRRAANFVGADGLVTTTPTAPGSDDSSRVLADPELYGGRGTYGFPATQQPSNELLWQLYKTNPSYFTFNEDTDYRARTNLSQYAKEVISAAYLRADVYFFNRRLKLIGGLRAEQTNITGEGPLTDPTRNFQRDASGRVILGPNRQPLPITTNALEITKLTLVDRGQHAKKEYLRYFPSINIGFNIRDNFIARAAYYHSLGRPNLNQYAGGIMLPNPENPNPNDRITVNNAGIKAWAARTTKVMLEYYFEGVGVFSVGAFRRNFENFFGATVFRPTPEFLALYGLDPAIYGQYDVSTQHNIAAPVRMEGYDFNYKQALTFLPHWARGVQVFANATSQRALGDESANFAGYIPRSASWGISLTRQKFNLGVNWNYRSRNRQTRVMGTGIPSGTFIWEAERLFLDLNGEYHFNRRLSFFANLRNVNNGPKDTERVGPDTPEIARLANRNQENAIWIFGFRGTY